jgi:transposase InsO family protein
VVKKGITTHGVPQKLLTDNGAALSPSRRGHQGQLLTYVTSLGIEAITGKPYKPTTLGKNERFHRALFRFLDKQTHIDSRGASLGREPTRVMTLHLFGKSHGRTNRQLHDQDCTLEHHQQPCSGGAAKRLWAKRRSSPLARRSFVAVRKPILDVLSAMAPDGTADSADTEALQA